MNFIEMYLDYFNNFISLEAFAEHYEISLDLASLIVKEGKIKHELSTIGYDKMDTPKQKYFDEKMSY